MRKRAVDERKEGVPEKLPHGNNNSAGTTGSAPVNSSSATIDENGLPSPN